MDETFRQNALGEFIRIMAERSQPMKKLIVLSITVILTVFLSAQELQHEAVAINVEVPVRVFKGGVFIDDLTIDDFELYEERIKQKIDAVYLIKKTTIAREESELAKEEAMRKFAPKPSLRQFILVFDVIDYSPRLDEVIDHFFNNVFAPEDKLTIVTPINSYNLKNELFAKKPLEEVSNELKKKLKSDVRKGNAEYKSIMRSIITGSATYIDYFRLKSMRRLEQQSVLNQDPSSGITKDWSMNAFGALYEVAKATGGLIDSSANPAVSFQKASDATENYYLLYYTPADYKANGKFRNIKVKIKGKNYKVTHRAGYFAD